MTVLIEGINHDWYFNTLKRMSIHDKEDCELPPSASSPGDLADLEKFRELLRLFYIEETRCEKVVAIYDFITDVLKLVAPKVVQARLLAQLIDKEWLAHTRLKLKSDDGDPKLYRDHILHPGAVCAFGYSLLKGGGPPQLAVSNVAKLLQESYGSLAPSISDWQDVAFRSWILSSLCHDIFYPKEFIDGLYRESEKLPPVVWSRQLHGENIEKHCSCSQRGLFRSEINKDNIVTLIQRGDKQHGAIGALFLMSQESGYCDETSERRQLIYEIAALAIFHHHSKESDNFVLKKHPISYLLALSDECHEVEREIVAWSAISGPSRVGRVAEFISPVTSSRLIEESSNKYCMEFQLHDKANISKIERSGFNLAKYKESKTLKGFKRLNENNDFTFNARFVS